MRSRLASRTTKLGLIVAAIIAFVVVGMLAVTCEGTQDEDAAREGQPSRPVDDEKRLEATTSEAPAPSSPSVTVGEVLDGDTIRLDDGTRVRLVQIDAPERRGECYGRQAQRALRSILPAGTDMRLVADPALDERDRFGRQLRYVFKGTRNVNLLLVRQGVAAPWFFEGERGRYASLLLAAARTARAARRGLWRACPATVLNPFDALATRN